MACNLQGGNAAPLQYYVVAIGQPTWNPANPTAPNTLASPKALAQGWLLQLSTGAWTITNGVACYTDGVTAPTCGTSGGTPTCTGSPLSNSFKTLSVLGANLIPAVTSSTPVSYQVIACNLGGGTATAVTYFAAMAGAVTLSPLPSANSAAPSPASSVVATTGLGSATVACYSVGTLATGTSSPTCTVTAGAADCGIGTKITGLTGDNFVLPTFSVTTSGLRLYVIACNVYGGTTPSVAYYQVPAAAPTLNPPGGATSGASVTAAGGTVAVSISAAASALTLANAVACYTTTGTAPTCNAGTPPTCSGTSLTLAGSTTLTSTLTLTTGTFPYRVIVCNIAGGTATSSTYYTR
eukprot:NODE_283_length_1683_cov_188.447980_g209_i0.p1 GENE.NODE_283_length_1683_cov_188.447980_g209_i0~~NODE_283_length_1683_cov_188.447980_g209_i0.p1  ORF type:complete len:352 (+),score=29.47 NODE_283_length_1683_cov_188.447980_g209_i0:253-1308(+)